MAAQTSISVTDTSQTALAAIASPYLPREIIVQNDGDGNEVWLGFNETAVADTGIVLEPGDSLVLSGSDKHSSAQITAVCSSGETSTLRIEVM